MNENTKKYFFFLKFNILSCLFLVVRDISICILSFVYVLSEIGGVTILVKKGGLKKLGGLIQIGGYNPVAYYGKG